MRVVLSALALLLALAPSLRAEVTVRLAAGRVDIIANTAPLSEVLDRLARQTGMKVVYDGPAPRQLVTVSLLGRVPAQAVHDLLEGQGLNYAMLADATGTGVQTLLMTGSAGPGARPASAPSSGPRQSAPPPMSGPDSVEDPEDEPEAEEEEVEPQQGNDAIPPPGVQAIPGMQGAPNPATGGLPPGVVPPGMGPAGQVPEGPASPNTVSPESRPPGAPSSSNAPATSPPGMSTPFPPRPSPPPPYINPRFTPVSPLSPLGPFVPVVPGARPVGTPGVPPQNEPQEPENPPSA